MPAPSDLAVIVCSRERADMLQDALASIAAATPREVEILVVDSASTTPATREVAEAAGVRYVRSDVKGLSIARNLGLESTRPIVLYTDDDCRPRRLDRVDPARLRGGAGRAVTGRMLDHTLVDTKCRRRTHRLPLRFGPRRGPRRADGVPPRDAAALGGFDDVLGAGRDLAGAEDLDIFCRALAGGTALVQPTASCST